MNIQGWKVNFSGDSLPMPPVWRNKAIVLITVWRNWAVCTSSKPFDLNNYNHAEGVRLMANILCKTKDGTYPHQKPRVYFTCHPEDFKKHFPKLCNDIFQTHDCAIFYTEDMTAPIAQQDMTTDLESNNLLIVPVTFKLLNTPNRAMDADIPYAKEKHIPILPFMMEQGLDAIYSRPDKFGEVQYLNPYSTDITEVAYEEKLKKYLQSVLVSDEMAARVRAAFDAYIFLSYRKKDRRYANALMRLIHSHPVCRDIAIWYDEFLVPGESFRQSIDKAMANSRLFTLLVTPNLLEEPDGKPNFVMAEEYPAAHKAGMDILPVEMEQTDRAELQKKFDGIPPCETPSDEASRLRFLQAIERIAKTGNDTDPAHNFLIGLAYWEGIDVEVDRQRGLKLITSAAEGKLPEAMKKLYELYNNGADPSLDYTKSAHWAQQLADHYQSLYGQAHSKTLTWLHALATAYGNLGKQEKALELRETVYDLRCKVSGKKHPATLSALCNLAFSHYCLGEYKKAVALQQTHYSLCCRVFGQQHPSTLQAQSNYIGYLSKLGQHKQALELQQALYTRHRNILGQKHPQTIASMGSLAYCYIHLGDHQTALALYKAAHKLKCETLGAQHPNTLETLVDVAYVHDLMNEKATALSIMETVYACSQKVLGQMHPTVLSNAEILASYYVQFGDLGKAIALTETLYRLRCDLLGQNHPDTKETLLDLLALQNTD